ncbi:pantothenate kinase [Malassezia vespertilionis]|uniref:Pantothenate kinase n=1 Tax=Malassezia vespertilionis TaxID=2020962 RepID=A0A2N1JC06_9BASI|nr:pantothenate kinase [Malassezia vespertilionis]PKI84073.1 hypothetical protein MVES_002021 [Malassezia vespertilionis]WFD06789.1 pantothenate kinase [Malassezia vespertilionis]
MLEPPSVVPVEISLTTHGARIIDDEHNDPNGSVRDTHDIYLPNHVESISHIAVDIGGSLAKVVYFAHVQGLGSPQLSPSLAPKKSGFDKPVPHGTLSSAALLEDRANRRHVSSLDPRSLRRRSLPSRFPGGRLNFSKFETGNIQSCIDFLKDLIERSAKANQVDIVEMRRHVKLMATGGGAHFFYDDLEKQLGVEVLKEDEMDCLITGLNFMTFIPDEVFWYSDELVDYLYEGMHNVRNDSFPRADSSIPGETSESLPRPSPQPPIYKPVFESDPAPKLPCLLVNIGSGVSILKVDETGHFERVSGTSLGGGTLWGLLSLLTDANNFDEMLELCERGDNSNVDMLVGDIYGPVGLNQLGLKASTIASSFGKVFRWDRNEDKPEQGTGTGQSSRRARLRQEDICRSLLYAISNNIGQIAHLNAEKYKLDRIYFGGCFIRGHQATISTLSYAIRFWSKGRRRAYFLRHEGYLGAVGAWIHHIANERSSQPSDDSQSNSDVSEDGNMPTAMHINSLLAEALGGASLDAPAPHARSASSVERPRFASAQEVHDAVPMNATNMSVNALLENLALKDAEEISDDPASVASIMAQLDAANSVADTIETRVNSLLSKLGSILHDK